MSGNSAASTESPQRFLTARDAVEIARDEATPDEGEQNTTEEENEEPPIKLYKSTRLKGYFTLLLSSSLNYVAAYQSDDVILANAVPATDTQRRYAQAAAMVPIILSFSAVLVHLDRWTSLRKVWMNAFRPGSCFELCFILFLLVWWFIATWIETSVEGIAGDGKGQYNLYFSTWACFVTCVWTLDRWLVAKGMSSLKAFLASWPNRAPGCKIYLSVAKVGRPYIMRSIIIW